jgi:hypothetical protein
MYDGKPFPTECPQCHRIEGWPASAQPIAQSIVVRFTCRNCLHGWSENLPRLVNRDKESIDVTFRPKLGRRAADRQRLQPRKAVAI